MRRTLVLILVGLMMLPAAIASANPPSESGIVDRFLDAGTTAIADFDDDLLVLVNVTSVDDFCNGEPAGAGLVQRVALPGDVLVVTISDDVPVVVVPVDGFESACDDPAGYPVIATGTAKFRLHDNDALGSGTRGNVFGRQLHGTVADDGGNRYNLTAFLRVRITPDGDDRLLRSDVSLVPR